MVFDICEEAFTFRLAATVDVADLCGGVESGRQEHERSEPPGSEPDVMLASGCATGAGGDGRLGLLSRGVVARVAIFVSGIAESV